MNARLVVTTTPEIHSMSEVKYNTVVIHSFRLYLPSIDQLGTHCPVHIHGLHHAGALKAPNY